jgi:hypothetical protein
MAPEPSTLAPAWFFPDDSIYSVIRRHLDLLTGSLRGKEITLPDEDAFRQAEEGVDWYPADETRVATVAALIDEAARSGDPRIVDRCHERLKEGAVIACLLEVVFDELPRRQAPPGPLGALARQLATGSRDRGAVKAGIHLLGLAAAHEHVDVVMLLGRHAEFSFDAAVALRGMLPDPTLALWELARAVDGHARVDVVERMRPTDNVQVQRWLRTSAYQRSMEGYLAKTAAKLGRLSEALQQPSVAEEELAGACELVTAMIIAAPSRFHGMDTYEDGGQVCGQLLHHVARAAPDLSQLEAVLAVLRFVTAVDGTHTLGAPAQSGPERPDGRKRAQSAGWDGAVMAEVESQARLLIARPEWVALVREGLASSVPEGFDRADRCAAQIGIDTFDAHWRRLLRQPQDMLCWHRVAILARADRIGQIVSYAENVLPLDEIASGPEVKYPCGPEFNVYTCLTFVLQVLPPFPGHGRRLILAGLRSPAVYNRAKAVAALEAWPPGERLAFRPALLRARREEVMENIQERIARLC